MRNRILAPIGAQLVVIALTWCASVPVAGQAPTAAPQTKVAAKNWTVPHTAWGDPDLQGVWDNSTTTPLERPNADARRESQVSEEGQVGAYNNVWSDHGKSDGRTAMIVDPPDGRRPPLTPEALRKQEARAAARGLRPPSSADQIDQTGGLVNSWEDRSVRERCIVYHTVPMLPTAYNNNYQIVQTPGVVAILVEEIHEIRIIALDDRPHPPPNVHQWLGDSRGHWEGNTLVVDSTNFADYSDLVLTNGIPLHDANLHVIERFTRVDADTIEYRFTVDDPTTYTKPWTATLAMRKNLGMLYEYACNEDNYGLYAQLSGARAQEKAAAAKK